MFEIGFEKVIGRENVQSSSVYFNAQKSTGVPCGTMNSGGEVKIVYDIIPMNVGGALSRATGEFTAPKDGKYFFSVSGVAIMVAANGEFWAGIKKKLASSTNTEHVVSAYCDEPVSGKFCTFTTQAMQNLKAGDRIWVEIWGRSSSQHDDSSHYNNFIGWLIEEDLTTALA